MITFEVRGVPVPQGSLTARSTGDGRAFVVRNNRSNLVAWRHAISDEARKAMALRPAYLGPVACSLMFLLPKPVSRPKKDKWPDRKPDLDKLARAALDGLSGVAFVDDAQVVKLHVQKRYANVTDDGPGLLITIWAAEEEAK